MNPISHAMSWIRAPLMMSVLVAAIPLSAQDETSTLLGLVDRADAIVEARVVALPMPGADLHRVVFAVQRVHKGSPPARFELSEPALLGCGRALSGLVPGIGVLAFLHMHGGQPGLVTLSARALPHKDPELLQHVQALLRSTDHQSRARILAAALRSDHARIRRDAALSLAVLPGLETADQAVQSQIGAVVEDHLRTKDPVLPSLLQAAHRARATAAIDPLLSHLLADHDPQLQRLLLDRLASFDAGQVASRLAAVLPTDQAGRRLALRLVERLPLVEARPLLQTLYLDPSPTLGAAAGVALLRLGGSAGELPATTDGRLAKVLSAPIEQAPRFRSIRPHPSTTGANR